MQGLGHVRLLRTKPTKPLADGGPSWRIPKGNLLRAPAVAPRGLFVSGHLAYLDHLMFRAGRFHRARVVLREGARSRVSFFMNKFRRLGFVDYNGGGLEVHSSLLNVVLHD
jgi:hypothetical protein